MQIPLPPPPGTPNKGHRSKPLTERQAKSDSQVEELLGGGEFSLSAPDVAVADEHAEVDEYDIEPGAAPVSTGNIPPGSQFRKPSRRLPDESEIAPSERGRLPDRMRLRERRQDIPIYYDPN
jgi:hypothetical protein